MPKKMVAQLYDVDTIMGNNNEGYYMVFPPGLEDTDTINGNMVFNGQKSVLFCNLRDAFSDRITDTARRWRSQRDFSAATLNRWMDDFQKVYPEILWNKDGELKYKQDADLPRAHGSKAHSRRAWAIDQFAYKDGQWMAGSAELVEGKVRAYAKGTLTITLFKKGYANVLYGSRSARLRAESGVPVAMEVDLASLNDTEVHFYQVNNITHLAGLPALNPGDVDLSGFGRLREIILGDEDPEYTNTNTTTLNYNGCRQAERAVFNGCSNLVGTLEMAELYRLKYLDVRRTGVRAVNLMDGGVLETFYGSDNITSVIVKNLSKLLVYSVPYKNKVTTLWVENCPQDIIGVDDFLEAMPDGARVRLVGMAWEFDSANEVSSFYDNLDRFIGLSHDGANMDQAQVSGTVHIPSATGAELADLSARYPYITINADHTTSYAYYYNDSGSELIHTETIIDGANGTYANTYAKAQDAQYTYTPDGWALSVGGKKDANAQKAIVADRKLYAAYTATTRKYTATFVRNSEDGGGTLYTQQNVPYGNTASYSGSTPTTTKGSATDYPFKGWSPSLSTPITGNTTFYAVFGSPAPEATINETWDELIASVNNGTYKTKYHIGDTINLDVGSEGTVNAQIAAFDTDQLADGSGTAAISFAMEQPLKTGHRMNPSYTSGQLGTGSLGGYANSEMKTYLDTTIWAKLPETVRNAIVSVKKYTYTYYTTVSGNLNSNYQSNEKLYLLSAREVGITGYETSGITYSGLFTDDASRVKKRHGASSAVWWWLRSSDSSNSNFRDVSASGGSDFNYASYEGAVVAGFSIGRSA